MPSVTLAESAKLALNDLAAGVIEDVITVNHMFQFLPFDPIEGNALSYNREATLGDVQSAGVDDTITAKAAATFNNVTASLTTILGDAEVNGLIQSTRSSDGNDQTATQISSKAKSVGRSFQNQLINGTGSSNTFAGLLALASAGQKIIQDTGGVTTNGGPLSFAKLDELIDLVVDKDGEVDYLMMHGRTIRSYLALLRALGGTTPGDMFELPSGKTVPAYRNIPIFRNDWIPVNQTQGSLSTGTTVFAGTFDDGSRTHGISGLTSLNDAGIVVEDVGTSETKDNRIWRVKWYCGLALFSDKGLALLQGVSN